MDPFSKLGIPSDASTAAIKTAYRKLCMSCHPDLRSDKEAATMEFRELTRIYQEALGMVGKAPPKPPPKEPPPKPKKPSGPLIEARGISIDDFEFTLFGEVCRELVVKGEILEYGATMAIRVSNINYRSPKHGAFTFQVPPQTKSGQKFRFQLSFGIVELMLVKGNF